MKNMYEQLFFILSGAEYPLAHVLCRREYSHCIASHDLTFFADPYSSST
jgi:hypothetical protein